MKILLLLGAIIVLSIYSVLCRLIITHPIQTVLYGLVDIFYYFKYKKYNWYEAGHLDCYAAHFGGGKTLSIVHYVTAVYRRCNNKLVWDRSQRKFVKQQIHVISNVAFTDIPYQPLDSLGQVVNLAMNNKELDKKTQSRTVILVVIDEASAQLNSRNFKNNIDPTFLNTLITSRHYHLSILYSSQKFKLTDKLMRDVTQRVIQCKKVWRYLIQYEYKADDLEYASDPSLVRPVAKTGWFILNRDYNAYDTLAVVGKLKKSVDDGDMLSEKEILELRDNMLPNDDSINRPSKRLMRRRKKKVS